MAKSETKALWNATPKHAKKPTVVPTVDEFVNGTSPGKMTRLNVQIPDDLHKRVKSQCAIQGRSMTKLITEFLEQEFPKQ